MTEILEGQTLEINNLISFRGYVTQMEIESIGKEMELLIEQQGACKIGNPITATYGMNGDKVDIEILIPIDKEIASSDKFTYKEKLKIVNAVMAKYTGHPKGLQDACNKLNEYMENKKLVPVTVGYNVTKKVDVVNLEDTEIDIYVGISLNIL